MVYRDRKFSVPLGFLYENVGFKNKGFTLELRFPVGIGRSGTLPGRFVSY